MASGDVFQKPFSEIIDFCIKYSCSKEKLGKGIRETKSMGGVTRIELGNLLENFKRDILGTISS